MSAGIPASPLVANGRKGRKGPPTKAKRRKQRARLAAGENGRSDHHRAR